MGVVDKGAKAAIKAIDQFSGSLFGGQLEKAEFKIYKKPDLSGEQGPLKFFINPSSITVDKEVVLKAEEENQQITVAKYSHTNPVCLKLGELWFDTYDTRESVREKYIDKLETLLDVDPSTHYIPVVVFNWGKFSLSTDKKKVYKFYVTKLSVEYQMFLPDATPVRAKVALSLEQCITKKDLEEKQSPDHAKLYTVQRGDTLQGIASQEYDDPREWRRIAETNELVSPLDITPGMKLLVPPILK